MQLCNSVSSPPCLCQPHQLSAAAFNVLRLRLPQTMTTKAQEGDKERFLNFKDELVCHVIAVNTQRFGETHGEPVLTDGSGTEQNILHLPTQSVQ